jgi:hypothetical protein
MVGRGAETMKWQRVVVLTGRTSRFLSRLVTSHRFFLSLDRTRAIVLLVVFVGSSAVAAQSASQADKQIVVISSLIREEIASGETDCFSFFPQRGNIFGADHSSETALIPIAEAALAPLRYREGCRYVLGFNIIRQHVGAVSYGGNAAELLMSFNLCALQRDGSINAEHCTSKNVYLLQSDLSADTAFKIGVTAFAQKQDGDWSAMKMSIH